MLSLIKLCEYIRNISVNPEIYKIIYDYKKMKIVIENINGKILYSMNDILSFINKSRQLYNLIRKYYYKNYTGYDHINLHNDMLEYKFVEWFNNNGITYHINEYITNYEDETYRKKILDNLERELLNELKYVFDYIYNDIKHLNINIYRKSYEIAGYILIELIIGLTNERINNITNINISNDELIKMDKIEIINNILNADSLDIILKNMFMINMINTKNI